MALNQIVAAMMAVSLIIWVGGAVTGQIWMFRAGLKGDIQLRAMLVPQIYWTIRFVYIPMAVIAFVSGLFLVWRNGISLTTTWVAFPIVVFLATIIVGSIYSLPEYGRLVTLLKEKHANDADINKRIELAAWVNRIELLLVLVGVIGIIVQPNLW